MMMMMMMMMMMTTATTMGLPLHHPNKSDLNYLLYPQPKGEGTKILTLAL
jgi:hypothetical protein